MLSKTFRILVRFAVYEDEDGKSDNKGSSDVGDLNRRNQVARMTHYDVIISRFRAQERKEGKKDGRKRKREERKGGMEETKEGMNEDKKEGKKVNKAQQANDGSFLRDFKHIKHILHIQNIKHSEALQKCRSWTASISIVASIGINNSLHLPDQGFVELLEVIPL